jgi:hypothetical protein
MTATMLQRMRVLALVALLPTQAMVTLTAQASVAHLM